MPGRRSQYQPRFFVSEAVVVIVIVSSLRRPTANPALPFKVQVVCVIKSDMAILSGKATSFQKTNVANGLTP